ncbi:MAG: hypothetical protein EA377_04405 [Phycisphaerales bacterium]|nr:MAG: hypothetical protein EA377_04405 [Phycisphaerales bacterium]
MSGPHDTNLRNHDQPPFSHERDADRLVTIATAASEIEANLLVTQLTEGGFEAVCFSGGHAALPLGARRFRIPVQVRAREEESARAYLKEMAVDDIDWDSVDVGEREDDLPLNEPARMPVLAIIAAVVAGMLLLMGFIGALLLMFF